MPGFGFPNNGGAGPSGKAIAVNPARVLYVQPQPWPNGADPLVYFNSIQAAINMAAMLAPTETDQALIVVYPGVYTENLVLISNVQITGAGESRESVTINGTVTYAPTDLVSSVAALTKAYVTGAVTVNTLGDGLAPVVFILRDFFHSGAVTYVGRMGGFGSIDQLIVQNAAPIPVGPIGFDVTSAFVAISSSVIVGLALRGTTLGLVGDTLEVGGTALFDSASVVGNGNNHAAPVSSDPAWTGSYLDTNSQFQSTITNASAAGLIDVRACEILGGEAALVGPGPIDRSLAMLPVFGPSAIGPNPVAIVPPLSNGAYNVAVTDVTPGAPVPIGVAVTGKAGAGFVLTDLNAGRSYDLTVLKE